jgi:hypothetical protein
LSDSNPAESLKDKLNKETAKMQWSELQRFYANGSMVAVGNSMDLIKVAIAFSEDDKSKVQQWLAEGSVYRVEDAQAAAWHEQGVALWAVVVAPWVLVQQPK